MKISRQVSVSFTSWKFTGKVVEYHVIDDEKKKEEEWNKYNGVVKDVDVKNGTFSAVITNLEPRKQYKIRIFAENKFGKSTASDILISYTKGQ